MLKNMRKSTKIQIKNPLENHDFSHVFQPSFDDTQPFVGRF
jgi:hypothetical protein